MKRISHEPSQPPPSALFGRGRILRAFTVVELLVAVSIMSVIIYGLYAMFSQTQKALHSNIAQVDILESGRAAMDLMSREIQELSAAPANSQTNLFNQTNLFIEMSASEALRQPLLSTNIFRTNALQDFFFLTRLNNDWAGIGYHVIATNGVGTLFRFETRSRTDELVRSNLSVVFRQSRANTNLLQPVTEGVIHLRLQTYNSDGVLLSPAAVQRHFTNNSNYASFQENGRPAVGLWIGLKKELPYSAVAREASLGQVETRFQGPGLPAYVDLELGILDPKAYEKFRALSVNRSTATNFLAQQAGNVHLFRQRIPIRTAPR